MVLTRKAAMLRAKNRYFCLSVVRVLSALLYEFLLSLLFSRASFMRIRISFSTRRIRMRIPRTRLQVRATFFWRRVPYILTIRAGCYYWQTSGLPLKLWRRLLSANSASCMSDCVRKNIKLSRLNYSRISCIRCSVTCLWFVSRRCHRCVILMPCFVTNSMEQRVLDKLSVALCGALSSWCVQNSPYWTLHWARCIQHTQNRT